MLNVYWWEVRSLGFHWAQPELQLPIALVEFLGGIFLITGIFTRVTSSIFAVILLGAIFMIKGLDKFSGSTFTGWEFDLVMLAAVLAFIVAGPGKVSIAHALKKIPVFLHWRTRTTMLWSKRVVYSKYTIITWQAVRQPNIDHWILTSIG